MDHPEADSQVVAEEDQVEDEVHVAAVLVLDPGQPEKVDLSAGDAWLRSFQMTDGWCN